MTRREKLLRLCERDYNKYEGNFDTSQLKHLLTALIEENEKLRAALEFYADYMNYSIDYDTSNHGFSRRCILYSDIEERNAATGLAGKRARQALAESPLDAILEKEK